MGETAPDEVKAQPRSTRSRITEHPGFALTLVGLGFYGGSLFAYSEFYGVFGVQPEEVGLNYVTALTRTVLAFVLWLLTVFGVFIFLCLAAGLLVVMLAGGQALWRKLRRKQRTTDTASEVSEGDAGEASDDANGEDETAAEAAKDGSDQAVREEAARILLKWFAVAAIVVLGLFAVFAVIASRTAELANQVKEGASIQLTSDPEDVNNLEDASVALDYVLDAIYRNPLRIRVEWVRVSSADAAEQLPASLNEDCSYAYLGQSSDTIILYDVTSGGRTLRVPAARLVLSDAHDEPSASDAQRC